MAYRYTSETGQRILLDNQTTQTIVTVASSQPGQQQQASSSFQTGTWTAPPQAFQTPLGILIKIQTVQGEQHLQIQGGNIQIGTPAINGEMSETVQPLAMQPVEPPDSIPEMQPMQPMQPMQMGNMSMSLNPMEMRMGNMELRMDSPKPTPTAKKFCSQCGTSVKPNDRFCTSCGARLHSA